MDGHLDTHKNSCLREEAMTSTAAIVHIHIYACSSNRRLTPPTILLKYAHQRNWGIALNAQGFSGRSCQ